MTKLRLTLIGGLIALSLAGCTSASAPTPDTTTPPAASAQPTSSNTPVPENAYPSPSALPYPSP